MADEPDNDKVDDADAQTPPEEAPAAPEAAAAPETEPASEAQAAPEVADAAPPAEAQAAPDAGAAPEAEEVAPAEEAPESSADSEARETPPPDAPASAGEPAEQISPKERRRRARSRRVAGPRPSRTPEERHAERLVERRVKAVRRRARRLQERAKAAERRAAAPAREPLAPVHAPVEGTRRVRQGIVVSDKAEKTITVRIDIARRHRRYEKIVRSSSTLHAHDENNDAHEGDVVRVIESRPLSRSKRWKLVDVVERAR
jgi:small subunit ribosomal protein S17